MKIALVIVLVVAVILIGVKVAGFWSQENDLNTQLGDITARYQKVSADHADLVSDVQYLADPINLVKELRSRFNYKQPGETMVIIVPGQTSTATSTP